MHIYNFDVSPDLLCACVFAQSGLVPVLIDAIEVAGLDSSWVGRDGQRNAETMLLIIAQLSGVAGCKVRHLAVIPGSRDRSLRGGRATQVISAVIRSLGH